MFDWMQAYNFSWLYFAVSALYVCDFTEYLTIYDNLHTFLQLNAMCFCNYTSADPRPYVGTCIKGLKDYVLLQINPSLPF
jgi:hypothetical protein